MSGSKDATEQIDDYKEKCKKEAESLVTKIFPQKFLELNELLQSEKFSLKRLSALEEDVNIPVPDPILLNNHGNSHDAGEPQSKKRRISNDLDNIQGSKVMLFPNGSAKTNKQIVELVDVIKPKVIDLIDHANQVKMWITYLVPRIEDGNNFGVSIQEETLSEARQVESEAATYLDQISRYFMTRGKIISKIAKYPHVDDIRRTVVELDEKEFISLRLVVFELRNNYASLHDLITKNIDKIKKPRNSNAENMY